MSAKVSVIMSVFDGEAHLPRAVDSILGQDFGDFEFIIVDDGSTDGTLKILQDYAKRDSRVRLIENAGNEGLAASLNKAIEAARSPLLARQDADDYSRPERLSAQVKFMDEHEEIGVLGCIAELVTDDGRSLGPYTQPENHPGIVWTLATGFNAIAHPSAMMRKNLIQAAGGYDAALRVAQDYDLWCRLVGRTHFANLPETHMELLIHDDRLTNTLAGESLNNLHLAAGNLLSRVLNRDVPVEQIKTIKKVFHSDDPLSVEEKTQARGLARELLEKFRETEILSFTEAAALEDNANNLRRLN